ncbi:MAG: hypothetical protein HYZ75_12615 [Elusimicrobia bacterium]|nr:hypothetical protein [Elusimicrobiota bacterium]
METETEERMVMDYPRQGEHVSGPGCTFRVGASDEADLVEISVDSEEWRPCRRAQGYWWYEWESTRPGLHCARARASRLSGGVELSGLRRFILKVDHGE